MMDRKFLKYIGLFAGLVVTLSLASYPVFAQTYFTPVEDKKDLSDFYIDLSNDDQDLADEYLDIVEQLQEIIEDYTDYLQDLDTDNPCDDQISFKVFEKGLAGGLYAEDITALKEDIEYYIEDLSEIQQKYKKSDDSDSRHCYRISRSLKRELSILNDLIDQNISNRIVQKLHNKEFQLYLQESILKFAEKLEHGFDLAHIEEQIESLNVKIEELDLENFEIPAIPPVTVIPRTPVIIDRARPKVQTRVYINDRVNEESGLAKVFTDRTEVKSSREPIYITNPVGNITVTGKDIAAIEAELDIEVSADSRDLEKNFVISTGLDVENKNNSYVVTVSLPQLKDPQTKVLNSNLVVSLPYHNEVICENSFGRVEISHLQNGLTLKANYSEITISDIKGTVEITNNMNTIDIENVDGRMNVTSSYCPVTIRDSKGEMSVSNSYARVSVLGSEGRLTINNSGETEVENHTGDVDIENIYGLIKVDNIYGNLAVTNAFSPIETREVRGSVSLGNTYALIAADEIEGQLKISNKHGRIDARNFNGPVDINNEGGNVFVTISQPLNGLSQIYTTNGLMNIAIGESSDIFVKARTSNGNIQSAYPFELVDQGNLISGELKLGKANDSLTLVGNNSTIIIKDTR